MSTHVEHVMGMAVSIDVRDDDLEVDSAVDRVVRWLHWVDATFSTYRADSVINAVARGRLDADHVPRAVRDVLDRCEELKRRTAGFFDAFASGRLDPSGLVKGWSVDVASELLTLSAVRNHAVNAGGDLRARGVPEVGRRWRVGIAHPLERSALCAVLETGDAAVATSGTNERGAHVIDPHTGRPATELASVTIVGPELGTADAFATAAFAMGRRAPAWLLELEGYEALVVDREGYLWSTPGLDALLVNPPTKPGRPSRCADVRSATT